MKVTFFVTTTNTTTGEATTRTFNKENVTNPFAYKKGIQKNEEFLVGEDCIVKVGFKANPEDLQPLLDEAAAWKAAQQANAEPQTASEASDE